jgi:fatty-acyl-CoA synthase
MTRIKSFLVSAALFVSLALPVYFAAAALSTRFGLIDWRLGFGTLTLGYGPMLLMGAAGLALVALLLAVFVTPRTGIGSALLALVIPALALGYAGYVRNQAAAIPPIHDIVSDPAAPLVFSDRVLALRADVPDGNPVEVDPHVPDNPRFGAAAGQSARELQQTAYSDIHPILIARPPGEAFEAALAAARAQGWSIDATDPSSGRIEASVRSLWFGFIDDVVVQVSPSDEGSRIDLRSTSRVGVSDLGANAARVRAFQSQFE